MIKDYIAYIKDNPKGYWFKAKWYGWGWTPASWQGWVVLAIYVVLLAKIFSGIDNTSRPVSDTLYDVLLPFAGLTFTLILICFWKGEKPYWNWGEKKKGNPKN